MALCVVGIRPPPWPVFSPCHPSPEGAGGSPTEAQATLRREKKNLVSSTPVRRPDPSRPPETANVLRPPDLVSQPFFGAGGNRFLEPLFSLLPPPGDPSGGVLANSPASPTPFPRVSPNDVSTCPIWAPQCSPPWAQA